MILYYVILLFSAVPKHPWFGSDVGGITLIKITGAICLVYVIFRLTTRKSAPLFFSCSLARLFIVIFLTALTSYIVTNRGAGPATPPEIGSLAGFAPSSMSIYFSIGALFFITLTVIDSPWRLRASLYSIMGGI